MTIEHAIVRTKPKPWGSLDLRPWSLASTSDGPIGELWFERPGLAAPKTALLLKMLFTTEPLSIQVHPDDAFARSIGLANGKTEAWYIVSTIPGAKVAVGLNYPRSAAELRTAVTDGSIADIVHWHPVHPGDVIFIPAGTIHAIGAGIVLVEIQQHSDTTFRLYDYGRERQLHIEDAVAVATAGPREIQSPSERLSGARTALTVNSYFALEQTDLAPGSVWMLDAPKETWLLAIEGHAQLGSTRLAQGDAVFLEADHAEIEVGANGLKALLAYPGPNVNPAALIERSVAGASRGPHAFPSALVPSPFETAALKQSETPNWLP
ncbi:class I mannose-6-phosphate isomerase [Bradyrhizobium sp. SSUT18]|uniref:class I mannose-6-phosphate isomerase n=1 Tax=unclassified Bradyrhizobium TaxID=2631580 RepID=UPI00244A7451|nr:MULTISPECIES: class I mannose-6-phosphate isomerase [unclassified Bradyrhizobium]MDH2348267.1 class I mannose-6-phosphate isomerase [Bradyrhizobium sp. SSUT77]MDH2405859.1 class I mannose-6-phosphate isomerase [Bradyrhizobium sp. SSUT18]